MDTNEQVQTSIEKINTLKSELPDKLRSIVMFTFLKGLCLDAVDISELSDEEVEAFVWEHINTTIKEETDAVDD